MKLKQATKTLFLIFSLFLSIESQAGSFKHDFETPQPNEVFGGGSAEVTCSNFEELLGKQHPDLVTNKVCQKLVKKYLTPMCNYIQKTIAESSKPESLNPLFTVASAVIMDMKRHVPTDKNVGPIIVKQGGQFGTFEFNFDTCKVRQYEYNGSIK